MVETRKGLPRIPHRHLQFSIYSFEYKKQETKRLLRRMFPATSFPILEKNP